MAKLGDIKSDRAEQMWVESVEEAHTLAKDMGDVVKRKMKGIRQDSSDLRNRLKKATMQPRRRISKFIFRFHHSWRLYVVSGSLLNASILIDSLHGRYGGMASGCRLPVFK